MLRSGCMLVRNLRTEFRFPTVFLPDTLSAFGDRAGEFFKIQQRWFHRAIAGRGRHSGNREKLQTGGIDSRFGYDALDPLCEEMTVDECCRRASCARTV